MESLNTPPRVLEKPSGVVEATGLNWNPTSSWLLDLLAV